MTRTTSALHWVGPLLLMTSFGCTGTAELLNAPPPANTGISLQLASAAGVAMQPGDQLQLNVSVSTASASLYRLRFQSSKAAVAAVSPNGLVTAVADGAATITAVATLLDSPGSASANVSINVASAPTVVSFTGTLDSSYRHCADEGGTCAGVGTVAYGYGTSWFLLPSSGSLGCDNATFGDPAVHQGKSCFVSSPPVDAGTTAADAGNGSGSCASGTSSSWVRCANENETCSFSGTRRVLYGLSTTESCVVKTLTGGTPCDNATFGDPAVYHGKQCWYEAAAQPTDGGSAAGGGSGAGGDSGVGGGSAAGDTPATGPLANGPPTSATFESTSAELENPERGFYFRIGPDEACSSVALAVRDGQVDNQKVRLVYYEVNPATITADHINADMACFRAAGLKVIFGQVYCSSFGCDEGVTIDQAEAQLAALKAPIAANKDVIAFMRFGVIGGWGEWATWGGNDVPESVKTRVVRAILDMTPPEIMITMRTPAYVQTLYPNVLTQANAFNGTPQSRMGFVNDCFLAGDDDEWTYPGATTAVTPAYTGSPAAQRAYASAMTEFTPSGAETCDSAGTSSGGVMRLSCTGGTDNAGQVGGIMNEGPRYHLTYLHRGYYDAFMNTWLGEGCYDRVNNLLGYRFQLDRVTHSSTANKSDTVPVAVDLRDVGWARIFSARKLVVTFKNRSTGASFSGTAGDARQLPSQATSSSTVTVNVNVPATASAGSYDVFVSMPDVWPKTKDLAAYAVRFANADVGTQAWDATLARFQTGTTVVVK